MKLNRYPKYKPTGIAWLPEVPEGWEMRRGRYAYSIDTGSLDANAEDADGLYPFFTCSMFPKRINTFRFDCEALLVAGNGLVGFTQYYNGKFNAYQRTYVLSDFIEYSPHYLRHYLGRFLQGYADYNSVGSVISFITIGDLRSFPIPFPPLPTQRAIVAFLDEKCGKVNRLVAAKEKEVALLKELKQSMIAEAVTRGVRANRRLVPSGIPWLPEIPEGWECGKVRQYFRLRVKKVSEKDYPPLSVAKVGVVPQLSDVAISMAEGDTRKLVKEGDYVVNSRSDRKGSCGIAPRDGSVTTISIVLEPHDIERKYVHYLFRSTPWVEEFYRNGRGIVADLWTTNFNQMRNMMLPIPPLAEQREIVAHIEARATKIDAAVAGLEKEIAALKEYKQRLIADVVTGQRKVA